MEDAGIVAISYRTRQLHSIFPIGRHNQETPLFLWGQCSASWAKINTASGRAVPNVTGPPAEALQKSPHCLYPASNVSCILGSMCWFQMLVLSRPFCCTGALLQGYGRHQGLEWNTDCFNVHCTWKSRWWWKRHWTGLRRRWPAGRYCRGCYFLTICICDDIRLIFFLLIVVWGKTSAEQQQ